MLSIRISLVLIILYLCQIVSAQPDNDNPCNTDSNPPIDLTTTGSHTGTTCEATLDLDNLDCPTNLSASVWYTYTPSLIAEGFDVTLIIPSGGNGAQGEVTIEVYQGLSNQGCTGFTETITSSCNAVNQILNIPNCIAFSEVIFIKVATDPSTINCGEFVVSIDEAGCGSSDLCSEVTEDNTLYVTTPSAFEINYNCLSSCLDYSCPEESSLPGCGEFSDYATSWIKVEVDDEAQILYTTVQTSGTWQPVWSVFGGTDCGSLEIMNSVGTTCSDSDSTPDLFEFEIPSGYTTFWIAVTASEGTLPPEDDFDGSFEFCAAGVINGIVCFGDAIGCDHPGLTFEVTDREVDGPLAGPFCPGEEVTINVSIFFDGPESGDDHLIGVTPRFGNGWDVSGFDFSANAPTANGSTAEWYTEEGGCAPLIQEDVSHLCTYINSEGKTAICNTLCEPCNDCPNQGMSIGDPLPSGYFWVKEGTQSGCDNDCSPGEGFGLGSYIAQFDWEFTVKIKDFEDLASCEDFDLGIAIQPFSAGLAGCFENTTGECLVDQGIYSPIWEVDCMVPTIVVGGAEEICNDESVSIPVNTTSGGPTTILVTFIPNPNITGATNHTINSNGIVVDFLTNTSSTTQTITYQFIAEEVGLTCSSDVQEVEVTVYPEMEVSFPPTYICDGDCVGITPQVVGGSGQSLVYAWSTGELSSIIYVCPLIATTYSVTVTDNLGCSVVGEVEIDVKPPVIISLMEEVVVCKDSEFDPFNPDYDVALDFLSGSSPYSVDWIIPDGLIGMPSGVFDEEFIINEVSSSEFLGPYELCAEVIDFFGCMETACVNVIIDAELILVADLFDYDCGDTLVNIDVNGFSSTGVPILEYEIWAGCPEETFIGAYPSSNGQANIELDLPEDINCITVVGYSEVGCVVKNQISINGDIPEVELSGMTEVCEGEVVTLTIENASEYTSILWDGISIGEAPLEFLPTESITLTLEVETTTGCAPLSMEIDITVYPADSPNCSDPCDNISSDFQISGFAYSDDNENGIFDASDQGLGNVIIADLDADFSVFTDEFGFYVLPIGADLVNLSATISAGTWVDSEIQLSEYMLNMPCVDSLNFGFVPFVSSVSANVFVSNNITRCNNQSRFYITVENTDHAPFSGSVEFDFDDEVSFYASDIEGLAINNNTAIFETGEVAPFTTETYVLQLQMPNGSSSLPVLDFEARLNYNTELVDKYVYDQQLLCSYDPNDKRTNPDRPGLANLTLVEEVIDYTIRFQNNGNDTAFHVRLIDVIDPSFDLSSIRFIESSHDFDACISHDSLIIDFPDILLVDSTTNYEASQGFVSLSLTALEDTPHGTLTSNIVDIYFDQNDPITTNQVNNTIVDYLCMDTSVETEIEVCAGQSFMGHSESGIYADTLYSVFGCDSIIILELTIAPPVSQSLIETICLGDSIYVDGGGAYYFESTGLYQEDVITQDECIEVISFDVTIISPEVTTVEEIICAGDSYMYEGITYMFDSTGVYEYELIGVSNCVEQIIAFDITITSSESDSMGINICEGESIIIGGDSYLFDSTGVYVYEFFNMFGCLDKILTLDVTVVGKEFSTAAFTICEEAVVEYEGNEYYFDSTGIYVETIVDVDGCIVEEVSFEIVVIDNILATVDTAICEGLSYEGLTDEGVYELVSIDESTGCQILTTVNLSLLPAGHPDCIVATNDIGLPTISIYPVPVTNLLYIDSEVGIQYITILSVEGRKLKEQYLKGMKKTSIDVANYPKGVYFIHALTNAGPVLEMFVVQ